MIDKQVEQAKRGERAAEEEHLEIETAQGEQEIEKKNHHDRDPPSDHVFAAEAMSKGNWTIRG